MKFLNNLSDKKYAKYKNRLHYVYSQLYRTQIYKEYLIYKKHKSFQINDGILKINNLLKKINRYSKDRPKVLEEIAKITNKNQKRFLIYLFLKIFNSWKFLKNHGFVLSSISKYLYKISLARVWQVKKKRYSNYIKTSFGSRKYNRRYFIFKGFPMETLDDVRCWLFYFKKVGKTALSSQFNKKEYISNNQRHKNFIENLLIKIITKRSNFIEGITKNLKINYANLFCVFFSFVFFAKFFDNFFKKVEYIFFEFLTFSYNFLLKNVEDFLNAKKNDFLISINSNNITISKTFEYLRLLDLVSNKKIDFGELFLLSNLFLQKAFTNKDIHNFSQN